MPWRRNSPPSSRSSPNWASNSPRHARTPRPPPSPRPPTSSSRPSRRRRRARTDAASAGSPAIPSTNASPSRPRPSTAGPSIIASTPAPRAAMTCGPCGPSPPRVVQQVDVRRGPAVDPGAPQSSGVVPALSEGCTRPRSRRGSRGRPGRAVADHADRLPQGGLPRLLLDRPQVPPRRRAGDDLARRTGPDHRQGQPGAGATLSGVARRPARPGAAERR